MPKKRIDRSLDLGNGSVTFTDVASGEAVVADILALVGGKKVYEILPEIAQRLLLHGANGKFGDSAADPNVDAIPQIKATIEQVTSGTWNAKGTGSGPKISINVLALFEVMCLKAKNAGKDEPTLDKVVDALDKKTPEQRKEIFATAEVASAKAKIVAARSAEKAKKASEAAKGADTDLDSLLG
jgi:hypothetical protein